MGIIEIILLGVALAMDCFSVSISKGLVARKLYLKGALTMALFFGLFQAGMPLIGYFAGTFFAAFVQSFAPWIALGLLGYIGGKMVWEHFHPDTDEDDVAESLSENVSKVYSFGTVLVLSVATSIDALASGLIFVGNPSAMITAVIIIGSCSYVFSIAGTLIGVFVGRRFKFPAELVGGLILIGIGLKIFLEGMLG